MREAVVTARELNRATLARQLLLRRERLPVGRAVERLCALQAQYSPSPYLALWSRLEGFERDALTHALERRQVVKATLFRMTLHLFSARDYLGLAGLWFPSQHVQFTNVAPAELERLRREVDDLGRRRDVRYEELYELVRPAFGDRLWRVRARSRPSCTSPRAARGATTGGPSSRTPSAGSAARSATATPARRCSCGATWAPSARRHARTCSGSRRCACATSSPASTRSRRSSCGCVTSGAACCSTWPARRALRATRRRRCGSCPSGTRCCSRTTTARACCRTSTGRP
ncbi:MAG: winged helix DNA-binding domain-containing protein [Thermoleophilia bacterium]|nr:winged helix DNA-binding domain-containing protein [Thermoleophilia bacterium]